MCVVCGALLLSPFRSLLGAGALTVSGLNLVLGGTSKTLSFSFRTIQPISSVGQGVHLDVPASFGQSLITMNDVDFEVQSADVTLVDTCGVSTSMRFVKTDLTSLGGVWRYSFLACGANAIAPGELVTIKIGTGATYQVLGANGITTPATAGVYTFSVSGQGGSFDASMGLGGPGQDITTYVNVSGTVEVSSSALTTPTLSPSSSGGGGGGGGGGSAGPDTGTLLTFSDPTVELTGTQSARIRWASNIASTSEVLYGRESGVLGRHRVHPNVLLEHEVTLTGLQPGQIYFYKLLGRTVTGLQGMSREYSFALPPVPKPVVSDLQVLHVGETSAEILWYTNKPTSYTLSYGVVTPAATVSEASLFTYHRVFLTNLTPNARYLASVKATDEIGTVSDTVSTSFYTNAHAVPTGAEGFTGSRNGVDITLWWELPLKSVKEIRLYRVNGFVASASDLAPLYRGTATMYMDPTIERGNDYTYCVEFLYTDDSVSARTCLYFPAAEQERITLKAYLEQRERSANRHKTLMYGSVRSLEDTRLPQRFRFWLNKEGVGSFTLLRPVLGTVRVGAKGVSHLRIAKEVSAESLLATSVVDFTEGGRVKLRAGDLYLSSLDESSPRSDNRINSLDLSVLLRFLTKSDEVSDLDGSGQVNSLDLSVLLRNLNAVGHGE